MVDRPKLDQMLSNLRQYVAALRQIAATPEEQFLSSPDKIGSAKYHLIIAIECCIDIANHVIASENYRFPRNNADSLTVLVEQGILAADRRESLRAMVGFRNRLVHLYWEVEDARVHGFLQNSLSDLEDFGRAIATYDW